MYLTKTPNFIRKSFPNFIWNVPSSEKDIYLTFDDGPIAEVTPFVLKSLSEYKAKATFFCVGQNIENNPEIFEEIKDSGHGIGSHSHNHLSGWTTDNVRYVSNVKKAADLSDSILFRPPYGRIKPSQAKTIGKDLKIVMWDVLSGDFDPHVDAEKCFQNVIQNSKSGSIIVFHDSQKSYSVLKVVLPRVLKYYTDLGYNFRSITPDSFSSLN